MVVASYAHFFAGPLFGETPPDRDIDYFTGRITYESQQDGPFARVAVALRHPTFQALDEKL